MLQLVDGDIGKDCFSEQLLCLLLSPHGAEAITALEAAAREAGNWMEVARLVHLKATHATDAEHQLEFLADLGPIYLIVMALIVGGAIAYVAIRPSGESTVDDPVADEAAALNS